MKWVSVLLTALKTSLVISVVAFALIGAAILSNGEGMLVLFLPLIAIAMLGAASIIALIAAVVSTIVAVNYNVSIKPLTTISTLCLVTLVTLWFYIA